VQLDFHYYATYAITHCAGFSVEAAKTLATAAQFVDDNAAKKFTDFDDGSSLDVEATAHHAVDVNNLDQPDQRNVWVPFHFLPAGEGATFTEQLICQKDSKIAQAMRDHHIGQADKTYYLHLLGIMAHVYGDTFSHYGFSGVSSRWNRIVNDTLQHETKDPRICGHIAQQAKKFRHKHGNGLFANIRACLQAHIAEETGALGHGPVLTYPDRPYLKWSFQYERSPNMVRRNNQETFLEYCKILHEKLQVVVDTHEAFACPEARKSWDEIEGTVCDVIAFEGEMDERINAWQVAAQNGLFNSKAPIPPYEDWNEQFQKLDSLPSASEIYGSDLYRFYQAASYHRWHVLRLLLPSQGIVVN